MPVTVKQYSLLDYSLSITLRTTPTDLTGLEQDTLTSRYNVPIGGSGKYLGSIKFTKSTDNIGKTVDATGAGVYSFTNDHSGSVDIEISQVSDTIAQIINNLAEKYHTGAWRDTMVDIVMSKGSTKVIEATSCMLVKMPDFAVANEVAPRTFSFLAMEIKETAFVY